MIVQQCAFFDRDGVINQNGKGYTYKIEDFVFCDGIFELLAELKKQGFLLLVITNQSGIERGLYTQQDMEILHTFMQEQLTKRLGFGFECIYFCPHLPEKNCDCRKPQHGMITQALSEFDIDLHTSLFIGDKITDMQCAQNGGVQNKFLIDCTLPQHFIQSGKFEDTHFTNLHIVANLSQIRAIITQQNLRDERSKNEIHL